MALTINQEKAIHETGLNILVSAGAGSGKTTVLTKRVLEKINQGIHINELLILTFTNAAAAEMKERIKRNLEENNYLTEISKLDTAYITTFDSFALSIIKKYHYLLNLPQNITITSETILNTQKRKILDDIFNSYYESNQDEKFKTLIYTLCNKDDNELKETILSLINKLEIRLDLSTYLKNYINNFYSPEKITSLLQEYTTIIDHKINELFLIVDEEKNNFTDEYLNKILASISPLKQKNDLDTLLALIKSCKLPMVPRGSEEETKEAKEKIKKCLNELTELTKYGDSKTIASDYLKSQELLEILIEICQQFFVKLNQYKMENYLFDFQDIAKLSLKILTENQEIREILKNEFKEIMIDEYQDTSDIQEACISLISNNNVYMVGDIKQSIYRFRNANPYIFRAKYNSYSQKENGLKIDLLENFRSRQEVLDNINTIFNPIMDEEIGNADYIATHQMIYGNKEYEEKGQNEVSHQMSILTYPEKNEQFSKEEIEIFTIGHDILTKVNNGYPLYDIKSHQQKKATWQDFCIIMDRNTTFDLTKKIFEYLQIPLALYKDEELNTSNDIYLVKNIISFLINIKEKNYDESFRHSFLSLARSFLYRLSDDEIFKCFSTYTFKDTIIYQDLKDIAQEIDIKSIAEVLEEVLNKTNFYAKIITIGNIKETITRIEEILKIANEYNQLGKTIYEFDEFLEELLKKDEKIKYNLGASSSNSVKIMNIHKSKGLEFPICYFCGLYKSFSKQDLTSLIIYEKDSPIYIPIFKDGLKENFTKLLIKEKMKHDDISEKIRLFYVALTRAKEKIIFLLPEKDTTYTKKNDQGIVSNSIRYKYKSLADMLYSIPNEIKPFITKINLDNIPLTKKYLLPQELNLSLPKEERQLNINPLNIETKEIEKKTFSKQIPSIISKEEKENMLLGTKFHETLELFSFKNPDFSYIDNEWIVSIIKNMLKNKIFANLDKASIYQEYEFIYEENNEEYHGIIDLMLVYSDHINIIDYKLNNLTDTAYIKQLNGYKKYIEMQKNLPVYTYLFSILTQTIKEVN